MNSQDIAALFDQETLAKLFPADRADQFFEALFGDASEGAYDISLVFKNASSDRLDMELHLSQRPGCCLACNLTYGLPEVFSRHPIINVNGVVQDIDALLGDKATCGEWRLERTVSVSTALHIIPLTIVLS